MSWGWIHDEPWLHLPSTPIHLSIWVLISNFKGFINAHKLFFLNFHHSWWWSLEKTLISALVHICMIMRRRQWTVPCWFLMLPGDECYIWKQSKELKLGFMLSQSRREGIFIDFCQQSRGCCRFNLSFILDTPFSWPIVNHLYSIIFPSYNIRFLSS